MQVEGDRAGIQSRSFDHLCPCPQLPTSKSCFIIRVGDFERVGRILVKGVYQQDFELERIHRLFVSTLKILPIKRLTPQRARNLLEVTKSHLYPHLLMSHLCIFHYSMVLWGKMRKLSIFRGRANQLQLSISLAA